MAEHSEKAKGTQQGGSGGSGDGDAKAKAEAEEPRTYPIDLLRAQSVPRLGVEPHVLDGALVLGKEQRKNLSVEDAKSLIDAYLKYTPKEG